MGPAETKRDVLKPQSLCMKQRPLPTMAVASAAPSGSGTAGEAEVEGL